MRLKQVLRSYGRRIGLILLVSLILMSLGIQLSYAQAPKDIVHRTDGGKDEGEIIEENFKMVKLRLLRRGTKTINLDRIENIEYANKPSRLYEAERAQESGNYPKAIETYRKAVEDIKNNVEGYRRIFKQHTMYHLALCLMNNQQYNEAIQVYDELFKEVPDTRYFRETHLNRIDCFLKKNNIDSALNAVESAQTRTEELNVGEAFSLRLKMAQANILERQPDKIKEARVIYSRLAHESSYPAIAENAALGQGRCHIREENHDAAQSIFNDLITRAINYRALAGAYNGLGDCFFHNAEKNKDSSLYKKALFSYLRTKVLYPPVLGESAYEQEKAIFYAARCLEILSNSLPADKKKTYLEYARILYQELKTDYPRSHWVPEAKERLQKIRSTR